MRRSPDADGLRGPLRRPAAVLLDFNGVVVDSVKDPHRVRRVAVALHDLLQRLGAAGPDVDQVAEDIEAGQAMYRAWKDGNVRRSAPRRVSCREFWEEFVASDWPERSRAAVVAQALTLSRMLQQCGVEKYLRDGMADFLEQCSRTRTPCALVSNTFVGAVTRDVVTSLGIAEHVAVQVLSDEVGLCKPDPHMVWMATRALGVDPAECWLVGNRVDCDVLCARRAGVGAAILMANPRTSARHVDVRVAPDAVVTDGAGLSRLLADAIRIVDPSLGEPDSRPSLLAGE